MVFEAWRAHVDDGPAEIWLTLVRLAVFFPFRTGAGSGLNVFFPVVLPMPSWPKLLVPQQRAVWSVITVHVLYSPAETPITLGSAAVPAPFSTFTGSELCVFVPLPSW